MAHSRRAPLAMREEVLQILATGCTMECALDDKLNNICIHARMKMWCLVVGPEHLQKIDVRQRRWVELTVTLRTASTHQETDTNVIKEPLRYIKTGAQIYHHNKPILWTPPRPNHILRSSTIKYHLAQYAEGTDVKVRFVSDPKLPGTLYVMALIRVNLRYKYKYVYICTCIDSATQAKGGRDMSSSGFAAWAQSAADRQASSDTRAGGISDTQPSEGVTKTSETSASAGDCVDGPLLLMPQA